LQFIPKLERLELRDVPATWTPLSNLIPNSLGGTLMMLLSDGTVMVQGGGNEAVTKTWYRLTPNSAGSYIDGTWTTLASMSLERLYFGSNILRDGRVFVLGGEYSGPNGAGNWTNTGEIFNPVANSWTSIPNFPQTRFGDDPTEILPNGSILAGYLSGPQTYIYTPATNSWSPTGLKLRNDRSDEETWALLPDGSILSYDIFSSISQAIGHAQRYVPSSGTWVDAGTLPALLSTAALGDELGPALLLPDGRVWQVGATNNTALYNPTTNTWAAGPSFPANRGADDAPGAILPNGHVIAAVDTTSPLFTAPTQLYDFDPIANSLTLQTTPAALTTALNKAAFFTRMLMLPNGDMLMSTSARQLWEYTPDGGPDEAWRPTVSSIVSNGNATYTLTGTQLNGISEGASYGDDAEMSSNYPIVRLTSSGGSVYYARTFNWSNTGVATGNLPVTTQFALPANLPAGTYTLQAIANGIPSAGVSFTVPPHVALTQVNDGSTQRSRVTSLTIRFDSAMTFAGAPADAFTLTRDGGGAVNFVASVSMVNGVTVATLDNFTGLETDFGSLRDGRYTLTALASQISAGGIALDGNGDGTPGGDFVFGDTQGLFRFFGDINGDRHVDIADFAVLSNSFNSSTGQTNYLAYLDFNGDGHIDIADFGQFSVRFFTPLP
jgi:hypothetical protein